MKKRNTEKIPAAQIIEETDHDGKIIQVPAPDEFTFMFYHSPIKNGKIKFLYIFSFDPDNTSYLKPGKTWPDHFAEIFPNATNVTQKEFDRLYRLHTEALTIPVGPDYILDKYLPNE